MALRTLEPTLPAAAAADFPARSPDGSFPRCEIIATYAIFSHGLIYDIVAADYHKTGQPGHASVGLNDANVGAHRVQDSR
jgi:hypothetical protein